MRHVAVAAQDSEHVPVHRTVHVEPPSQLTLPLGPTVTSHAASALQSTLHEEPQVPLHVAPSPQSSEQLLPLHAESPMSHDVPGSQLHDVPEQVGGGSPPQATAPETRIRERTQERGPISVTLDDPKDFEK